MTPELLEKLHARSDSIRDRWEMILRMERVSGPLANPDALVHLIPDSLGRIFKSIGGRNRTAAARSERVPSCDCGNNPYLAYFLSGERALLEAVVRLQSETPLQDRRTTDIAAVVCAVRHLASSEIDSFCSLCALRGAAAHCRFAKAAGA